MTAPDDQEVAAVRHDTSPAAHLVPLARALLRAGSRRSATAARALVRWDRQLGTGRRVRWEHVGPVLRAARPDLVSVDIFDTVLTRPVADEADVWWIVGADLVERGAWSGSIEAFVDARRAAAAARPRATLEELHRHPALAEHLPEGKGADAESQIEASLATPVPGAAAGLTSLRATGIPVVFLTDMHLHRGDLWEALTRHGLARAGDELVISSELGVAKSGGELFAQLRPHGRRVVHVGNDLWSDVAMAERAGVDAIALSAAEATALESLMAATGSPGSALAAAARSARLAVPPAGPVGDALVETGADVAGQSFTAFLLWVRRQCEAEGIRDVHFLARDGELPLRMARAMAPDHWEGFHLGYLEYASRRAWTVAAAAAIGLDAWMAVGNADDRSFLNTSRHVVPFASLLTRLALTPDDLGGHPELAALDPAEPLPIAHEERWQALLVDEALRERIAERAAAAYELLRAHLRDLDITDRRIALVDVGWRGQLAWMFSAVLRSMTGAEPVHLHFGGANVATALHGEVDIRRFAVDDSVAPLPFPHMVSCVETFTASGRARASDLRRGPDGTVELVFDPASSAIRNAARERVWDSAIAVAAALPPRATMERWQLRDDTLAAQVRAVLTAFWTAPSPIHAHAVAELSYEVDDAGTVIGPVAAPYRLAELRESHPAPRQWREGSLQLTPQPARTAFAAALALRDRRGG